MISPIPRQIELPKGPVTHVAVIENGKVTNIILVSDQAPPDTDTTKYVVLAQDQPVSIGDTFKKGKFTSAQPAANPTQDAMTQDIRLLDQLKEQIEWFNLAAQVNSGAESCTVFQSGKILNMQSAEFTQKLNELKSQYAVLVERIAKDA